MPLAPIEFLNQEELARKVEQARRKLGPEVVRLKHTVGEDSSGEPSIYFRIVITDQASQRERLGEVSEEIVDILTSELHPIENWGMRSYFRFRSQSEQAKRVDADWA